MSLAPKISDVAKTLRAAGMDDTSMTHVLRALAVAGHVDLENGKSPAAVQAAVQASAGSSHPRLRTPAEVAETIKHCHFCGSLIMRRGATICRRSES